MALVQIADIYEPQAWSDYFIEQSTKRSQIIQSGIAQSDPDINSAARSSGSTVDLPFWNDLSDATHSSPVTDDETLITPGKLTTAKDRAIKIFRGKSWKANNIVKYFAGDDPVAIILDRYVDWWVREKQYILLQILSGLFANATIATDHVNNIAIEDGNNATSANKVSNSAIEDTRFLLGDAYSKFTAMIVHSTVLKTMRNLDLITDVPQSQQNPVGISQPTYQGLRVLVDDDVTVVAGTTSGFKYSTFLFGQGAFAFENIPVGLFGGGAAETNVELYRQPKEGTGAGTLEVITRDYFLLHPRGVAWNGTPAGNTVTDSELATGTNWNRVFSKKNVRIAELVTNG